MDGLQIEEQLTFGASGQIIPLFRKIRRSIPSFHFLKLLFIFLQSIFLWFLLFILPHGRRSSSSSLDVIEKHSKRPFVSRKYEKDTLRRRALAEGLEMFPEMTTCGGIGCHCSTLLFFGVRMNALFCRSWLPVDTEIRGLMIIIHWLNEHSGRYSHFAMQLMSCNFGVYAMDWIGHGGSDGLQGYVPSLDHVVADTAAFLEKIKSENPEIPCFLFGHSTGGAVVLKAASYPQIKDMLEGIVLTSPALRVKTAHPIVGDVATLFSLLLPTLQFKGANKKGIPVSRDPAALLAKYSDPLVYIGPIRVRTGHEILRISAHLMRNLKRVKVPFLVLHGTADRVTDPTASEALFRGSASVEKELKLYDGLLHDLLFELDREEVMRDIMEWMDERLKER